MGHTPTTPADDRALRILERADVPDEHKERLFSVVRHVQAHAADAGAELQGEFGREAVAMIVGCNQFVRLHRAGPAAGRIDYLLPEEAKAALEGAGFTLHPPEGQVFRMFGWVSVDPMQADTGALHDAAVAAFDQAHRSA